MGRGGARVGAGRKRKQPVEQPQTKQLQEVSPPQPGWVEPLEYMLAVINDPNADAGRRDRMAVAAAPYRHARAEAEVEGKKAQRQANAEAASSAGKYAVPSGPKLVVSNR